MDAAKKGAWDGYVHLDIVRQSTAHYTLNYLRREVFFTAALVADLVTDLRSDFTPDLVGPLAAGLAVGLPSDLLASLLTGLLLSALEAVLPADSVLVWAVVFDDDGVAWIATVLGASCDRVS